VVPLPCPVSGDAAGGVWEAISPPQVTLDASNAGIPNVLTNPLAPGELYVSTYQQGIYKSSDCGSTWTKVDAGRNANALDSGTAWLFVIDPVTPNVLYADTFLGNPYELYKSTNGGVDWDSLWPGGMVAGQQAIPELLGIDPSNHEHLVATIHNDCVAPHNALCFAESDDGGATWRIIDGPTGLGWVEGAAPVVVGPGTFLLGSNGAPLYLTTDDGAHWTMVSQQGGVRMIAAGGWYYTSLANGLQRSRDLMTWSELTTGVGGEITYGLDTDGQSLFLASRSEVYPGSYARSAVSDGATWTSFVSPGPLLNPMSDGAYCFAVDHAHHILYSANQSSGLFRMVYL
jgi:hypothetical protein